MNLTDLFDLSLRTRRDSIGLDFQGASWTFGDIDARANRLAHLLLARGLAAGDRICVYLPNCPEIIDLYLACTRTGIIFVPINVLYRDREITHILRDAEPRAIVSREPISTDVSVWRLEQLTTDALALPHEKPSIHVEGDAPAAIIYTSGTTGTSKGALLTHNNFAANAVNLVTCWQITSDDRLLLPLPLFHVHGLANGIHCWLISGCRMELLERFTWQSAAEVFLRFRPSLFFGVPTIYSRLVGFDTETARSIGCFMRLFVSGSAPLPAILLEQFRQLYGHTILERYGMSETLMNMSNPYVGERRPGTVGFPLPGISVALLNENGHPVREGEPGEVHLRGPNVFQGYWRREEATNSAFANGFFRTGDLATRSADGYYTLCGRKSDLIISGGFNIYPREIEEFLLEQPEVAEAAVTALPDPLRGEVPVAFIVTSAPVEPATLESRCRENLASFKIPRKFVTVERLPRNALGKVQKHLLVEAALDASVESNPHAP